MCALRIEPPPTVDLAVLTRDSSPLTPAVAESIRRLRGVNLLVHRIVGSPRPNDPHRVATIARARNAAVQQAQSPWLMFLDDDVVLAPDCVARLHNALAARNEYAGFGADYLGEASPHRAFAEYVLQHHPLCQMPIDHRYARLSHFRKCFETISPVVAISPGLGSDIHSS